MKQNLKRLKACSALFSAPFLMGIGSLVNPFGALYFTKQRLPGMHLYFTHHYQPDHMDDTENIYQQPGLL